MFITSFNLCKSPMRKVHYYPHFTSENVTSHVTQLAKWQNRLKPKILNSISCALKPLYYITSPDRQKSFKIIGCSSNVSSLYKEATYSSLYKEAIPFSEFIDKAAKRFFFFPYFLLSMLVSNIYICYYLIWGIFYCTHPIY